MLSIYTITFMVQIAYWAIKINNIKAMHSSNVSIKALSVVASNIVWLTSITIGVSGLLREDYWILVPFTLGSLVGMLLEHYTQKETQ